MKCLAPVHYILTLLLLPSLSFQGARAAEPQFLPTDPAGFFTTPEVGTDLTWTTQTAGSRPYKVTDFTGKAVAQGDAAAAGGQLTVTVQLPRGYYEVKLGDEHFGVVSMEAFAGEPDPFFGMDAVLTWLDRRAPMRQAMVKSMKRGGIALARERINWTALEPAPGQWKWESDGLLALRETYAAASLPVLEMFHSAGPAKGKEPFPFTSKYPQDLVQLTESWPVIYGKLRPTWSALEVWNEPEGSAYGSRLPADQYAPLVQAMRYAWQVNGIQSPLGGGVLMGGDPGQFHRYLALNGVLENSDFLSIHDYKSATKTERQVAVYRAWLDANGKTGMPLWMTEAGWSWPKGGGRPPRKADADSALEITMKGVESKACGVVRYMPFCLAFYEEGGAKSFSMMGQEVTPLRSMAAYIQSIRVLAGKDYVGDLRGADDKLLRARVFESGKEQVAVLFTGRAGLGAKVEFPGKVLRAEGIDGRRLAVEGGTVPMADGLVYVWFEGGEIIKDTRAMALLEASRQDFRPRYQVSPIILQFLPDAARIATSSTRYMVGGEGKGELPIRVRVHNLAGQGAKLGLTLALPGEVPAEASSRAREVKAPARATTVTDWVIDTRGRWTTPEALPITVTARDTEGKVVANLAIPMQVEGELESFLPHYGKKKSLPLGDPQRWSANMTASGAMKVAAAGDRGATFNFEFHGGDRWAYPRFKLEKGALAGFEGFLLRVRVSDSADVRMALTCRRGSTFITSDPLVPADGKWHVLFVPLTQFEPNQDEADSQPGDWQADDISSVSVGINDRSENSANTLEVSDLYVVSQGR